MPIPVNDPIQPLFIFTVLLMFLENLSKPTSNQRTNNQWHGCRNDRSGNNSFYVFHIANHRTTAQMDEDYHDYTIVMSSKKRG